MGMLDTPDIVTEELVCLLKRQFETFKGKPAVRLCVLEMTGKIHPQ